MLIYIYLYYHINDSHTGGFVLCGEGRGTEQTLFLQQYVGQGVFTQPK